MKYKYDSLGYSIWCYNDMSEGLSSQFRSAVMSALDVDIVDGLTDGMSMRGLARFREYMVNGK